MKTGHFKDKAPKLLSWFVISCACVIVGLLFVMQKTEETKIYQLAQQGYYIE